jgi:2-oxoglutarate ferredoxin oxidoreductase subunit alpha
MHKPFLWKIGGEAGFGIMTTGLLMAKIATRSGYHIFDYTEYPSLVRGGHNTYEVVISEEEVHASKKEIDMLVCLNKETYDLHRHRCTPETIMIYDEDMFVPEHCKGFCLTLPIKKMLLEHKASSVMANTIVLGASLAFLGGKMEIFKNLMEEIFGRKGQDIVDANVAMATLGFEYVEKNYAQHTKRILCCQDDKSPRMVIAGNEAFGMASVLADCRMFVAYPMTPASSVLTYLASVAEKTGIVVRHAEDEISVIHTALGASFAGVRSSVATSGGGFALMVESIAYAGIAEIPIVIFLAQRPGPATGMPTWTEQGDLLFAVHAGHGDFPKIVLAPGDPLEMMALTLKAYDLADMYQLPVIVLSDKFLSESHTDVMLADWEKVIKTYVPNRGKIVDTWDSAEKYLRYKITDDGISPLLIPGGPGQYYQANSYEHKEDSHTTEDMKERVQQADKRAKKIETYLKKDFTPPVVFGDIHQADVVLVSWGGNKGAIMEAQKVLDAEGIKTAYIHFTHLFPLQREPLEHLYLKGKKYVLIENNQSGQFGKLLREQTGFDIQEKLLKYDGQPIFVDDVITYIKKMNGFKS